MANRKDVQKGAVPHKVMSDRGVHLAQAHQRQYNANIRLQRSRLNTTQVVIGQDENGDDIRVEFGSICPKCKMRVRGPNHASGMHHRGVVPRQSR